MCYGGGLVRHVDPRADEITYRNGVGDTLQLYRELISSASSLAAAERP